MKLVECVPNISEGRRPEVYHAVAAAVAAVDGVTLLNVDPGADTNRTVITFVGEPEAVLEAAFRLAQKGVELIDMTTHRGAHPRQLHPLRLPVHRLSPVAEDSRADRRRDARGVGGELDVGADAAGSDVTFRIMKARVIRRGGEVLVKIPQELESSLPDDEVDVSPRGQDLVISRPHQKLTLEELVAGMTENRHEETDWGPPVGNEVW